MGDGACLADFVRWSREKFPARREMLVIWDHGQGWRLRAATAVRAVERDRHIAVRELLRAAAPPQQGELSGPPNDMRIHGGVRYVSVDDDTGDKLYNRKIQDALTPLAKSHRLDVVAFDACLMAMLETGYALRDVASVLVGSEELEPGAGWNYTRWLAPLVGDPSGFDATKLGRALVSAYRDEYKDGDDTTMSSMALDKVPALAKAVTTFAARAEAKLASQLKVLKKARSGCLNYAPGYGLHSIDLARFLDLVKDSAGVDPGVSGAAAAARAALQSAVLGNYASTSRQGAYGSAGVAIYFPASKAAFDTDPDREGYAPGNTHDPVEFVQREGWAKFLQAYLAKVPS